MGLRYDHEADHNINFAKMTACSLQQSEKYAGNMIVRQNYLNHLVEMSNGNDGQSGGNKGGSDDEFHFDKSPTHLSFQQLYQKGSICVH